MPTEQHPIDNTEILRPTRVNNFTASGRRSLHVSNRRARVVCGGIALNFDDVLEAELAQFLLPPELEAFRRAGRIESVFWGRRPILPAILAGAPDPRPHLYDWGNREKDVDLPRTGWARWESVAAGRWKHLHPREMVIPARQGVEKGVWFEIPAGIEGLIAEKNGVARAYMITVPADEAYLALTGHDRMPKLVDRS